MGFTVEFRDKAGQPLKAFDEEPLDAEKWQAIVGLQMYDTIAFGQGDARQTYVVVKKHTKFVAPELSGAKEPMQVIDFTVEPLRLKPKGS